MPDKRIPVKVLHAAEAQNMRLCGLVEEMSRLLQDIHTTGLLTTSQASRASSLIDKAIVVKGD